VVPNSSSRHAAPPGRVSDTTLGVGGMTQPDGRSGRAGFDEALLGMPVPLLALSGHRPVRLDHTQVRVLLRTDRRPAAGA
jgi:hypothetical protein